jgi:signal peptidase II
MNSFIYILPFLDITHIHNYGIAFGFLTGLVPPWMIIIVSILITFLIIYMMKTSSSYAEKTGFLLIVIGASSNIVDRFINNYVLDFIYLHYGDFYWPAFNFADIYITIGVVFIIYKAFNDFFSRSRK